MRYCEKCHLTTADDVLACPNCGGRTEQTDIRDNRLFYCIEELEEWYNELTVCLGRPFLFGKANGYGWKIYREEEKYIVRYDEGVNTLSIQTFEDVQSATGTMYRQILQEIEKEVAAGRYQPAFTARWIGPKTITELKERYRKLDLPPMETTRFFIGIDQREKKAFGIYYNGKEYIVYKNKDDGERSIRYQGADEAYAVKELYLRLKSEIQHQISLGHTIGVNEGILYQQDYQEIWRFCRTNAVDEKGIQQSSLNQSSTGWSSSDNYDYHGENKSDVLKSILIIVMAIFFLIALISKGNNSHSTGASRGSYSDRDHRSDYDSDSSDSGWDSGDTDWGSDW